MSDCHLPKTHPKDPLVTVKNSQPPKTVNAGAATYLYLDLGQNNLITNAIYNGLPNAPITNVVTTFPACFNLLIHPSSFFLAFSSTSFINRKNRSWLNKYKNITENTTPNTAVVAYARTRSADATWLPSNIFVNTEYPTHSPTACRWTQCRCFMKPVYQVCYSGSMDLDGIHLSYFSAGRGDQTLVFLPGLGRDWSLWKKVIQILSPHFKIYAFSLPLYGSKKTGRVYNLRTFPHLLEKFLTHFAIKHPVLIGHSLGSLICLEFARQYPHRVFKLVLVSSPLTDHSHSVPLSWQTSVNFALASPRLTDTVQHLLQQDKSLLSHLANILTPKLAPGSQDILIKILRRLPLKNLALCFHDLFHTDLSYLATGTQTPILFVYGLNDHTLLEFHGTDLYPRFPRAEILALNCSHFIPSERPHELAQAISGFLSDP